MGGGGGGWCRPCRPHCHCKVPEQRPISERGILEAAGSALVPLRDALHDAGDQGAGASGRVREEGKQAAAQGCQLTKERGEEGGAEEGGGAGVAGNNASLLLREDCGGVRRREKKKATQLVCTALCWVIRADRAQARQIACLTDVELTAAHHINDCASNNEATSLNHECMDACLCV